MCMATTPNKSRDQELIYVRTIPAKDILKNSNVSVIREANGKKSCEILTLVLGMVGASLQGPP